MGGRTLIIKLTSAQLRYAANGAVAELGKNGPFWTMSHILGRGLKAPLTERKCSKIGLAYFTYFCIPLTTEHDVQAKKRRVVAY